MQTSEGRKFGVMLRQLRTSLPSEAQHPSVLLADDAGVLAHSSAVARGSMQKQFVIEGGAFYWQPPHSASCRSSTGIWSSSRSSSSSSIGGSNGEGAESPAQPSKQQAQLPGQDGAAGADLSFILHPTDCVVQVASKMGTADGEDGEGLAVHAAAVVTELPLSIQSQQVGTGLGAACCSGAGAARHAVYWANWHPIRTQKMSA
jgi:hypothetical protein